MRTLFVIISLLAVSACTPEQEATTFSVTVSPQVGENVQASTLEEQPVLIEYQVDEGEDSIDLTFEMVEEPKNGRLSDCKYLSKIKWQCVYTPNLDFNGEDQLAFKTRDGDFLSREKAYLKILVGPVDDAPVIGADQEFTLVENTHIDFKVKEATDVDTKASELEYIIVDVPENGVLEKCFQGVGVLDCKYTPTPEYVGKDKFTYRVKDSSDLESQGVATVYFNVQKERIPVAGDSIISIEDKKSNALIVFALDISNSMDPYLDHMKQSVANFVDDIAARGFKATLAFIDSDDKTTWHSTSTSHPTYPAETGAIIQLRKKIPLPARVKIFEIDAYDFEWNNDTKVEIANTKAQIDSFIDALPAGNDDERLLCSAVRFLHSDHAKGKDYVGIFSLANEDDAVKAVDLKTAHSQCVKEEVIEKVPIESCSKTVACNYGDAGCNGKFTYYYTTQETYMKERPYVRGTENYTHWYYKYIQELWSRGYKIVPNYVYQDVEECREEWKNADNPSGCRMVRKRVQDGTRQQSVNRIGSCAANAAYIPYNCTEYNKSKRVRDYSEIKQRQRTFRSGTCESRSHLMNCTYTPPVMATRNVNRTKQTTLNQTCLEATGYDTCYKEKTWSGTRTYMTTENCGVKNLPKVVKRYDVPNVQAADQTLVKSVHHKMTTGFAKSVYVAVANEETLNASALALATEKSLDLPSNDCLDYATNRTLFAGMDGLQFKALADLLGDQGDFYSICSPERYPSGKLDYLVEDSQLDFLIPAYETTDNLKVTAVEATYANGNKNNLSATDYNYADGHVVLTNSALAKNLVELKITYEGYKK